MFTGLVQQIGRLERVDFQGEAGRLSLTATLDSPLQIGESIAVNGACLTLVEHRGERLVFDVLRETLHKTALREKRPGAPLNLERALRVGDPLGGHWVSGHVDGTGKLLRIEAAGRDYVLACSAPGLVPEMVAKGSIAIDGVSLTLVDVDSVAGTFSVHVIPHTWRHTALSALVPGDAVNVETDMIGKYVRQALAETGPAPTVTWEALRRAGYYGSP